MKRILCMLMAILLMTNSALPVFAAEFQEDAIVIQGEEELDEDITVSEPEDVDGPVEELQVELPVYNAEGQEDLNGAWIPQVVELKVKNVTVGLVKAYVSYGARTVYTHLVNEEVDAPVVAFISSFIAGVQNSRLIEIQKTLADMSEQLTDIQVQISELRYDITEGFNRLEDRVLQSQYTELVNDYIKPVENEIMDSWAYYMYINYQTLLLSAECLTDEAEKAATLAQAAEMYDALKNEFTNWTSIDNRWYGWVSSYGTEGAFERLYDQWESVTKDINFKKCLQYISNVMISTAGEDTLFSVRERMLRLQVPFEYQIFDGMNQIFEYVADLQSRLLMLYHDYTYYLNEKDAIEYETVEECEAAQTRINDRSEAYLFEAETAMNTINNAESSSGILYLQDAESIHQQLTLKNGETIDTYYVKSNNDGRYYHIAKESRVLGDYLIHREELYHDYYVMTDSFKDSMESADGRFIVTNYEYTDRTLDGIFMNSLTKDALLYLRDDGGLKDIEANVQVLMTSKITQKKYTHHYVDSKPTDYSTYDEVYVFNAANYSVKDSDSQQAIKLGYTDIKNNTGKINGVSYGKLNYLPIYVDTHLYHGNGNTGNITQLTQIPDECILIDGDVLDLRNTNGEANNKTIIVSGNVKIIGGGASKPINHLTLRVKDGANLTIEDLYLSGSKGEKGTIVSEGTCTLTLNGVNKLTPGNATAYIIRGNINIVKGTGNHLIMAGNKPVDSLNYDKQVFAAQCFGDGILNATDIILETSAYEDIYGDKDEVRATGGTLTNCIINSQHGWYDVDTLNYVNCQWTNYAPYKVITQTGSLTDSGTSNTLILNIDGTKIRLEKDLDKGSTQTQYAYGPALASAPEKMKIKTDGSNAWYGISMQVYSNMSDYKEPDGRWMICQWVEAETKEIPNNNYGFKMKIKTANETNAGTDANITAAFGYDNENGGLTWGTYYNLSDRMAGNAFEKGNNETVYIRQDYNDKVVNTGDINWIAFKSDMAYASAGWKLYSAEITKMQAGRELETVTICPNQWVVDKNYAYTYPLKAEKYSHQYSFTVKTSNKTNAGTDSNISYQLVGTKGTTNWVTSSSYIPGNAYEKNSTACFRLTFDKSVGIITGVNVKSDLKNAAAGWHLDYIEVYETEPVGSSAANTNNGGKLSVNAWIEKGSDKKYLTLSNNPAQEVSEKEVFVANTSKDSGKVELEVVPDDKWGDFAAIRIFRADTANGEYAEVMRLTPLEGFKGMDPSLKQGERYYYKLALEKSDGSLVHFAKIFCVEIGKGIVALPDTMVGAEGLDREDITAALTAAGYDLAAVKAKLLEAIKKLSGKSDLKIQFYDLKLFYKEGDEWMLASKEHFPEDGELYVSIPVPAGSNPETDDYYIVHMFGGNEYGKIAGMIETPEITTHTDDSGQTYIDFCVTGLSPVVVGWAAKKTADNGGNTGNTGAVDTGDNANIALWSMMAAASGMALVAASGVLFERKKKR